LLALDEQYKKEVETNKMYKEQLLEYTSKISDLEKKVDIMTKSMMSSSCLASLSGGGPGSVVSAGVYTHSSLNYTQSIDNESGISMLNTVDDDINSSIGSWTERDYRLALWAFRRWRYHQMTSLRVNYLIKTEI
jgi:hypothetical protein